MKISLIRTNKKNVPTLKVLEMSDIQELMRSDTPYEDVDGLRSFMRWADTYSRYQFMYRLPVVYPSVQLVPVRDGQYRFRAFNGLLTLTVGPLSDRDDAWRIKDAVKQLPMTVCALLGSSGRSVKVIVRIARADGTLPQSEQEAATLCEQAYPLVCRLYQTLVDLTPVAMPVTVDVARQKGQGSMLMAGFRQTLDPQPFYRPDASPLLVSGASTMAPVTSVAPVASVASVTAATSAETVDTAAAGSLPDGSQEARISEQVRKLIALLQSRYAFRKNCVMGYVEYQVKSEPYYGWRPVDEQVRNSMAMEAHLAGLNVWDKDITRYLNSNLVRNYDPIEDYLWEVRDKWDGHDYIGDLARRVPTREKQWPRWFRIWFLAMVAQWRHYNPRYGNALAPLLISQQGYNKSTFCRMLIPHELQWGYNDNLMLNEKKSVLQAMSQFLLINLDEFNQISPKVQEGFLKNLIQLASVKVKRPYAKHVEEFPRLASFIATANITDILSDPSGNRRFIGVELTGPIDVTTPVNYTQLYAQAMALIDQGEAYWLDDKQTQEVMHSNERFQLRSPEQLYFAECFRVVTDESEGQWYSAAAVFNVIKLRAGATLHGGNVIRFSRILANIPDIQRRRTAHGVEYLLARRPLVL